MYVVVEPPIIEYCDNVWMTTILAQFLDCSYFIQDVSVHALGITIAANQFPGPKLSLVQWRSEIGRRYRELTSCVSLSYI